MLTIKREKEEFKGVREVATAGSCCHATPTAEETKEQRRKGPEDPKMRLLRRGLCSSTTGVSELREGASDLCEGDIAAIGTTFAIMGTKLCGGATRRNHKLTEIPQENNKPWGKSCLPLPILQPPSSALY